jgi:hypothetical protein
VTSLAVLIACMGLGVSAWALAGLHLMLACRTLSGETLRLQGRKAMLRTARCAHGMTWMAWVLRRHSTT